MKKNIYFCDTYYHLLITIIKNINNNNFSKNDLVIATSLGSYQLFEDKELINKLIDSKIFNKILFFDYRKQYNTVNNSRLKIIKYFKLLKFIKKRNQFNFSQYNNVYLFHDTSLYGKFINFLKIKYNLIEDGTDCFKNNKNRYTEKNSFKKYIKDILNIGPLGTSKYIKSIEVNDKSNLELNCKDIIEVPKKLLFESLNKNDKDLILSIFFNNDVFNIINNYSLLITQPFFIDNVLDSEIMQVEMYKEIINKYLIKNEKIAIKVHPREMTNYSKYFKNALIIKKSFPIELLVFFDDIKFDKIITVSSTAINLLNSSNEKIFLGWEWLEQYKNRYYN